MNTRLCQRALFRPVLTGPRASWHFQCQSHQQMATPLHYHAAYEISLLRHSEGRRYVGDSVEHYSDFDLVLIGPHLPHGWSGQATSFATTPLSYNAQLPSCWLESLLDSIAEFQCLQSLFAQARQGLHFSAQIARQVHEEFVLMANADAVAQFAGLIRVLHLLKSDQSARMLASAQHLRRASHELSDERLEKLLAYIQEHYTEELRAEQLAKHAHMSTNHFHRFIKQRTEKTFTEWVTSMRIGRACELLLTSRKPISTVASQCGFNDLSNFNRRFMQLKKCTPSEYRRTAIEQENAIPAMEWVPPRRAAMMANGC